MKTKFYWVALLASAAMIAQANAGGHHGGGGGGGFAMAARPAPAHAAAPAVHSAPRGNFGSGRYVAPITRFSRTKRLRHFVNSVWLVLIARSVASLQLEQPIDSSIDLEQLIVGKRVSHEMEMIPEIVSKTAV